MIRSLQCICWWFESSGYWCNSICMLLSLYYLFVSSSLLIFPFITFFWVSGICIFFFIVNFLVIVSGEKLKKDKWYRGVTQSCKTFWFFGTYFSIFSLIIYSDARVMWDHKTGRSKGYGFVSFRDHQVLLILYARIYWRDQFLQFFLLRSLSLLSLYFPLLAR